MMETGRMGASMRESHPSSSSTAFSSATIIASSSGVAERPRRRPSSAIAKAHAQSLVLGKGPKAGGSTLNAHTNTSCDWRHGFSPVALTTRFLEWLVLTVSTITMKTKDKPPSEQDTQENLRQAAVMLNLLREYESLHGMPEGGDTTEQEWVLQELCKSLCANGVPTWVLDSQLVPAAQGLVGASSSVVEFFLRPNDATMSFAGRVSIFHIQRHRNFFNLTLLERVLARLSSFATNTKTAVSLPEEGDFLRNLLDREMGQIVQARTLRESREHHEREMLANRILDLSSDGYGLFFLLKLEDLIKRQFADENESSKKATMTSLSTNLQTTSPPIHSFWHVSPSTRELFTRLATIEAVECLDAIDELPGQESLYPRWVIVLNRAINSGASSALWFSGSWQDMLAASLLAAVITFLFQTNQKLFSNKRLVFEVVVGFTTGLIAGLLSTASWPADMCFDAIALPAMIDYMRGFGACFSVMEVMSHQTAIGAADLVEALIFSFLIAVTVELGLRSAETAMSMRVTIYGAQSVHELDHLVCNQPIDQVWYLLVVPIASAAWAATFHPRYQHIPLMAFHGALAYGTSKLVEHAVGDQFTSLFAAALVVSSSAGLISWFTGRQALSNVITGLYALVPGIFVINGIASNFATDEDEPPSPKADDFIAELFFRTVIIGVAVWTGTLFFAPLDPAAVQRFRGTHEGKRLAPVLFI